MSSKMVSVTLNASLYSDAANCLSGNVGFGTKLVGVKTSPSHKVLSRRLNAVWMMCIFSKCSSSIAPFWCFPQNSHYPGKIVDDVLVIFFFHENLAPSNKLSWRKVHFLFLCCDVKKRNHPCLSLMQLHTNLNMKIQCNVFLPHALITRRQFQRLKYSVCPSVYTDDLIFTGKYRLIIATCCLYCWTNHLRRFVCLIINTAILLMAQFVLFSNAIATPAPPPLFCSTCLTCLLNMFSAIHLELFFVPILRKRIKKTVICYGMLLVKLAYSIQIDGCGTLRWTFSLESLRLSFDWFFKIAIIYGILANNW